MNSINMFWHFSFIFKLLLTIRTNYLCCLSFNYISRQFNTLSLGTFPTIDISVIIPVILFPPAFFTANLLMCLPLTNSLHLDRFFCSNCNKWSILLQQIGASRLKLERKPDPHWLHLKLYIFPFGFQRLNMLITIPPFSS